MLRKRLLTCISVIIVICMVFALPAYASNNHKQDKAEKHGKFVISEGIFKGDGNGEYFWADYVKRGDIVVMIVRAFKLSTVMGDNFPDVEENSYFYDAIRTAKSMGIAKGDGKKFNPLKYVSLGEAIALIERAVSVANSNVSVDASIDLHELYKDKNLLNYATRTDVADMLYYILTGDTKDEDEDGDEDYDLDPIEYAVKEDTRLTFDEEDFIDAFEEETDSDEDLVYVMFNLPAESSGVLYYDYKSSSDHGTPVNEATKYYIDEDDGKDLSKVSFIPHSDFTGIVSVSYTAYDEDNHSYDGVIKINVQETEDELAAIKYAIKEDTAVLLKEEDFIKALHYENDETLDYVKFTLPANTSGKLYYSYKSSSDYGSLVKATTKYYADSDDGLDLSKITFVPYPNYTGTVAVKYSAVDEHGNSYDGVVEITVQEAVGKIIYQTHKNTPLEFDEDDFIEALDDATEKDLYYVKFTLPDTSYGKLYYNYKSSSDYGSLVKATTKYYADSDNGSYISKVTFVPKTNYTGTFSVKYTAFDESGTSYNGTVQITVQ